MSGLSRFILFFSAVACIFATGCVRRTITISSEPAGALVWLNGREVGRTPVTVDFLHYGTYDVQLVADGYEPMLTMGEARPPVWDRVPMDLAAELVPGDHHVELAWHYQLSPQNDDPRALLDRARQFRDTATPAETMPAVQP